MNNQLLDYFNRYATFSEEELGNFYNYLSPESFKKKEFILRAGDICKTKFFITSGLVRTFRIDEKGNEKIIHFGIENWWVTDMEGFVLDKPSEVYIQTLEDTEILKISKPNLELAYKSIPKLERIFRIITEKMFIAVERKNHLYSKLSSKERYEGFVRELKDFAQRVPQYMIASYLDITPEYLSELRKSK